jgi:hypothetical protein
MKFLRQRSVWKPMTSFAVNPSWMAHRASFGKMLQ